MALAPAAAGVLPGASAIAHVGGALIAFCLLSSSTYLINDVRDRHEDRLHPTKHRRPIAAGELSPARALRWAYALAAAGIALATVVRPTLSAVAVAYLGLTLSYSLWWRHVPVADIAAVVAGFVLRTVAGALAVGVESSLSLLLVTTACAVVVVTGKRYGELVGVAMVRRRSLRGYSRRLLRRVLVASAVLGCLAYARWAFTRPEAGAWLELSMLPFVMWLARYGTLVCAGRGEAPEDLVLGDWGLVALTSAWAMLFLGGVYAAR